MKLLRKIAPLAVAGLLLGTGFAVAADLASWKASFPGADTAIIVGASAAAQDTIGAVDIATALGVTDGGQAPVEGAHLIEAPGNDFNYGEDIFDVEDSLEKRDLPTLLADGKYRESRGNTENDVTYEQFLEFTDGTGTMEFTQNTEASDKLVDTYLHFVDTAGTPAYNYRLVFDNPVEFDTTSASTVDKDFELTKLTMLGREYFIVDATEDGANLIDSLALMGGALKASQWEYSTETYTLGGKTYEVEVKIISDTSESAILVINGEETDEMVEGDTYTLDDGTRVGVLDVVPNEGAEKSTGTSEGNDLVTFYLGAEKIEFKQGNEVEINGQPVDGSEVDLQTNAAAGELSEINLAMTPNDDIFLAKGEEWIDPILGRFKFTYQGLLSETETIEVSTSGDDGTMTLVNIAGDTLEIPFVLDDTNSETFPGDEFIPKTTANITQDRTLGTEGNGNLMIANNDVCTGASSVENCEGVQLLVVGTGGEARIIEIKNIDTNNDEIDLKEVSPDSNNKWYGKEYADGTDSQIVLGFATITLNINNQTKTVNATKINTCGAACNAGDFLTSLGGEVNVTYSTKTNVYLYNDDGTSLTNATKPVFELIGDGGDLVINASNALNNLTWMPEKKDSDYEVALDNLNWGAIFKFESKDKDELTIEYPEEEAIHKVYVSELLTTIPELATGGVPGASVAVLDTEIDDVKDMNLISVGGSGINKVSAELLGFSDYVYGSDERWQNATKVDTAGRAIIKLMDSPYTTGKMAMLVAGWEGIDTQRAAKVLREGTPAISGESVLLDTATATVKVVTA